MANYQTISHINISKGMDTRSALKNIQEGFAEELRNMDTNSAGFSEKRKGYQSYVGTLPFRVTAINETADGKYEMEFDDSMSFSGVSSSPLLGKGDLWNTAGGTRTLTTVSDVLSATAGGDTFAEGTQLKIKESDVWVTYTVVDGSQTVSPSIPDGTLLPYAFLEPQEIYWESFINNIYKDMVSGVAKEFTNESGQLNELVGTAVQGSGSYELVQTHLTRITSAAFEHTITTPATSSPTLASFVVEDTAVFNTYTASDLQVDGSQEINIPQLTHNLPNKNLIYNIYQQDASGGGYTTGTLLKPNSFVVQPDGNIKIEIDDDGSSYYTIVIYDVPVTSTGTNVQGTGVAGTEDPINVVLPKTSEFVFVQAYAITGAGQEEILLDSVIATSSSVVVTIDVPEGVSYSDVKIVTLEGTTGTPSIIVGFAGDGVPDSTPQFCVYGIDPADVDFDNKSGHVNTLDEYSSVGRSNIVAGMGGNLFVESTDFTLTSTRVDIRGETTQAGNQVVAPIFSGAAISSITKSGTTATITFSGTPVLTDIVGHYVTVSGAGNPAYNGTFEVIASDISTYVTVEIGAFEAATETDTAAIASCDTFLLTMQSADHSFQVGDIINSNQFPEYNPVIRAISGTTLRIGGISGSREVYPLVTLTGTRTSNIIETPKAVSFFVKGDVITLDDYTRKFRVLDVDLSGTNAVLTLDESVEVSDSTLASTLTLVSLDSRWLCVEYPALNDRTVKHFSAAYDAQNRLQTAKINDSLFFTDYEGAVMKYDGQDIYQAGLIPWSPQTHTYVDISTVHEKIVVDNYLSTSVISDGSFATISFDKNTMPPLPSNGEIFIQGASQKFSHKAVAFKDYDGSVGEYKITVNSNDIVSNEDTYDGQTFTASAITGAGVPLQDTLVFDGIDDVTTVIGVWNAANPLNQISSSGTTEVLAAGSLTIASGTSNISIPEKVGYYFKLQAYDRNNNIVAGAVTDYRDCLVTILKTGRVYHRLNNLPKFSAYHYDRVDLEIYRTKKAETVTPEFFRIRTIPLEFQEYERSTDLLVSDSLGNSTFGSPDDLVSNAISLQTTGTALERPVSYEAPQKSKYLTSIANRMVQGNVKGYDSLDLRLDTDTEDTLDGITVATGGETYKFLDAADAGLVVTSIVPAADGKSMVLTIASSTFAEGEWIQLLSTATTNTLEKISGAALGWWKVSAATSGSTSLTVTSEFGEALTIGTPNYAIKLFRGSAADVVPVASFDKAEFRPFDGTRTGEITPAYISSIIDLQRAINTVQKSKAVPVVYAQSGAQFGASVVNLRSATSEGTVSAVIDTSAHANPEDFSIYGNNILEASGATITGRSPVFPSRLLVSPEKFPETFDNPTADSAIYSSAIIDVNADDGEEITGFSSFLAIASSSNSQVQSTLIVCKSKSVYAIDVITRSQTKLESSGQGCTIPGSIAPTAAGIMFANKSGIYVVTASLEVEYIGRNMEGYWNSDINKSIVESEAIAFTDSINRKYKLSVPAGAGTTNSEVVVYDYITDDGSSGSWSLYDNIQASSWTQTSDETVFGGYGCRVYKQRNADDATDYRDDTSAITSTFEYSPRSFGDSGSEVEMSSFVTHVEEGSLISVYEALDMSPTYTELDQITNDGSQRSYAVKNSPTSSSMLFIQVKYEHSVKDENFKLAGIDFKVSTGNASKIPDANS